MFASRLVLLRENRRLLTLESHQNGQAQCTHNATNRVALLENPNESEL
jgi:hypothetical protein